MVSINAAASMNLPTNSSVDSEDLSLLVQELRELGFDAIRFASYRTAAKLRYIQKRSNFILLDIWNVIEGIRENGLNALDPYSIITVPKVESVVTSLYVNLNKRLPHGQQVDVFNCARYFLSWMLFAYDNETSGRVRVFSVKVGLVTLCSGKLIDKLRYIFSQVSDINGNLVLPRFSEYLQEVLALPAMVLESPTFGFTEGLASTIFEGTSKISVNGFLDALLGDPGPPCLMWLPLLQSMASVEEVNHGMQCSVCKIGNIQGFRYKCQKCSNFNMCQNCFWQGKTTDNHRTEHEVKEYVTNKSGGKSFRNSFRKSLRCMPEKSKKMPRFPEQPERPLNLSHIVPSRMNSSYAESVSESDEEHRLIARYTARLASESKYPHSRTMSQTSMSLFDSTQTQRDMISELEARNREIMREIARLRAQQEMEYMNGEPEEPILLDELQALRYHKLELEDKLGSLQDSRRHMMGQLEGLMKLLKVRVPRPLYDRVDDERIQSANLFSGIAFLCLENSQYAQQLTPKSTPNSSPRSAKSPPMSIYSNHPNSMGNANLTTMSLHRSAPATPHHSETFASLTGELRSAFSNSEDFRAGAQLPGSAVVNSTNHGGRSLRNDLLLAADSVTNAMSSLVKELHTDEDNIEEGHIMKPLDFEHSPDEIKRAVLWKQEMDMRYEEDSKFLAELRSRKTSNGIESQMSHGSAVAIAAAAAANERNVARKSMGLENAHGKRNLDMNSYGELYDNDPDDLSSLRHVSGLPTDDESSYARTDDEESFVRTDDDDGGGTDWEESHKRWVNR